MRIKLAPIKNGVNDLGVWTLNRGWHRYYGPANPHSGSWYLHDKIIKVIT